MEYSSIAGRVKLRHLQCFLAVAQHGSLQKAADALSISQPAASKTLAELEELLGVRLFERGRHGAVPTRAAGVFQRYAAASVGALREGVDVVAREAGQRRGQLRIGLLPTVAGTWLVDAIDSFIGEWPAVTVRVVTSGNAELLELVRRAELDLAVGRVAEPAAMAGLSFEYLRGEPLVVVVRAGHPLTQLSTLAGPELAAYPLIAPPSGTLIRQSASRLLAEFGLGGLVPNIELLSVSLGRALVRERDFVWLVPLSAVRADLADGLLSALPLATAGSEEPVGLVLASEPVPLPSVRAMASAIRARARAGTGDSLERTGGRADAQSE